MRVGSLFAGIGGLELGLEWAGVGRAVWQVERDPFCRQVLAKHWPDAERFDDVRTVGAANLPPVEVICGGFPCQDISYAGKGAGLAGERSGLWYEYARIVRELRPRFVVVENVAALLTRGLDAVLGTLAALGYDAEWSCVRASDVGACHRRERVFVIAWRVDDANDARLEGRSVRGQRRADERSAGQASGAVVADSRRGGVERRGGSGPVGSASRSSASDWDQWQWDGDAAGDCRAPMADRDDGRRLGLGLGGVLDGERAERGDNADGCGSARHLGGRDDREQIHQGGGQTQPGVGRATHGLSARLDVARPGEAQAEWEAPRVVVGKVAYRADRLKALGNAVVPQVAEVVGRRLIEIAVSITNGHHQTSDTP